MADEEPEASPFNNLTKILEEHQIALLRLCDLLKGASGVDQEKLARTLADLENIFPDDDEV